MEKEILVLRGDDRITNNRGNVRVLHDLPVFFCELEEHFAVSVVYMADRWELKPDEWPRIRQAGVIKIDVMDSTRDDGCRDDEYTCENVDNAKSPAQAHESAITEPSNRRRY